MVLAPSYGNVVAVYYGSGADSDYANEAMEEVNYLSTYGYPRYTCYRIADATKQMMNDTEVPVFQKQVGGVGDWVALSPTEIWYGAGYIRCAALGATDLVRCATGHYLTPILLFGCIARSLNDRNLVTDVTSFGDTIVQRAVFGKDWDARLEAIIAKVRSTYTTSGGNANSHITLEHTAGGVAGDAYALAIENPGGTGALAVTYVAPEIHVHAAVTDGTITSTANDVVAAINANTDIQAIGVRALKKSGETGAGVVAALAHTHLADGKDIIGYKDLRGDRVILRFYNKYASNIMSVGLGRFESLQYIGTPKDAHRVAIAVSGDNSPIYQLG